MKALVRFITFVNITLMTRNIIIAIICCCFFACKNGKGKAGTSSETDRAKDEKKLSKRDFSINNSTSYNDLQLDSATLVKFIAEKGFADSIAKRITSFYNARNYYYAWFSSDGLTEQALGFWNLYNYDINSGEIVDKALHKKMDALIADTALTIKANDVSIQNTEMKLTAEFIQYFIHKYPAHYIKRKEMEKFIPIKKEDALKLADSLITKKHKDNKYFEDVNEAYKSLKKELER